MHQRFRPNDVVPGGLVVETARLSADRVTIEVKSAACRACCPTCGTGSRRVQSRYLRHVTDLPLAGRRVELVVSVRRFRCEAVLCQRPIFAERFAGDVLSPSARRTGRLEHLVHHLGLALGGRPAANFARRLMVPVSNDTLIRIVRRRISAPPVAPQVIGIDDFAFRRNHSYGTIVCDLEERRPLKLLPDREPATSAAWLSAHSSIHTVARDRGGGYGEAAVTVRRERSEAKGAPPGGMPPSSSLVRGSSWSTGHAPAGEGLGDAPSLQNPDARATASVP